MTASPPQLDPGFSRETVFVIALTIVGAGLRLWSPTRLGLVHFDEGIYALAGLWALSPRGLESFDPNVISYSPPGFPILVGASYLSFGVADLSAILVSILCGTLAIPAAGWLAHRTFGRGAGAAAAAFAAFSGSHVAFSRMALTDAAALLFWLLALAQGQRFLERPDALRSASLGLAVGLAQLFKYNGWITGAIVALGALLLPMVRQDARCLGRTLATWGWGLVAATVAVVVYAPWFRFVGSHGGYWSLLAHQRSYLSGVSLWPRHWYFQHSQASALSGGPSWIAFAGLSATLGVLICFGDLGSKHPFRWRSLLELAGLTAIFMLFDVRWIIPLGWVWAVAWFRRSFATPTICVLAAGWGMFAILTPFYHPYARLWLPLEAFGWFFIAGLYALLRSSVAERDGAYPLGSRQGGRISWRARLAAAAAGVAVVAVSTAQGWPWRKPFPGLLEPSDSLRLACRAVSSAIPSNVTTLRYFGRPPTVFYLAQAGGPTVFREASYQQLLGRTDTTSWALLDTALLRQEGKLKPALGELSRRWTVVGSYPTSLNLPTLLDVDPSAAIGGRIDLSSPLLLLRPWRAGDQP
jgi:4-amino-4-deoxy-L-arabinose transferase-like glycosyltransferase